MAFSIRKIALCAAVLSVLSACSEPISWSKLLKSKIKEHYPRYEVQPLEDGDLKVMRPGLTDVRIDVNGMTLLCQRGPKDCNYATDQMLLQLQSPS
jgi:hypothetical protein